jgi:hypothetical protein
LGVRSLSESVEISLAEADSAIQRVGNKILTEHTIRLLAYAVENFDRDDNGEFDACLEDNSFACLFSLKEYEVSNLIVLAEIDLESEEMDDLNAFLHEESRHLYVSADADEEDILDDVATEISRLLWQRRYKRHVDTVRALLSVKTEVRFRKLRDRNDWHLSREKQKAVDDLLKRASADTVQESDQPTEEESGQNETEDRSNSPETLEKEASFDKQPETASTTRPLSTLPTNDEPQESLPPLVSPDSSNSREERTPLSETDTSTGHSNSDRSPAAKRINRVRGTGKSRSSGISQKVNQTLRGRLHSYVQQEPVSDEPGSDQAILREEMGRLGELAVLEDLKSRGFEVERMPANNAGYDLTAMDGETGELLYLEVKGTAGIWSELGVGISPYQHNFAKEQAASFWLAIVENIRSSPVEIHYIQNPVQLISDYRFDDGWRGAATNLTSEPSNTIGEEGVEAMLLTLTDSELCKEVIRYCGHQHYPYPEVGFEVQDDTGRIISENIELAWEQEQFFIVCSHEETSDTDLNLAVLDSESSAEEVRVRLDVFFGDRERD